MKTCLTLLLSAMTAMSCARTNDATPSTSLSQERFVTVLAELAVTEPAQRPEVLRKHDTTADEIRTFVAASARNPRVLSVLLDSVQQRIDRVRAAGG